jgi:hypothetical protein
MGKVRVFRKSETGYQGGTYLCKCCGKLTRETGSGESAVDMCAVCYAESVAENMVSDGKA